MMDLKEAMQARHSVRQYTVQALGKELVDRLQQEVDDINAQSGLNVQFVVDEPEAFTGFMAHYGKFRNVTNYFAMIGDNDDTLQEKVGYFGERLVLLAQQLGLNTCWVALTFKKRKSRCEVKEGQKLVCVIAVGHGLNQGSQHKNKPLDKVCKVDENTPQWFKEGVAAAMTAPTAVNQQKFFFELQGEEVKATCTGGFFGKVDLGIVKYHFEVGADRPVKWAE